MAGTITLTTERSYKHNVCGDEVHMPGTTIERALPDDIVNTMTNPKGDGTVSITLGGKISDAFRYGEGTWDKIPYTISCSATVTLKVDQTDEAINVGQQVAAQLAWNATRAGLVTGVDKMFDVVREVVPGVFDQYSVTEVPDGAV